MSSGGPDSLPEGGPLELMRAMAVSAVPISGQEVGARTSRSSSRVTPRHGAATVAIAAGMGLYFAGLGGSGSSPDIRMTGLAVLPILVVLAVGLTRVAPRMREAAKAGNEGLAPLGLEIVAMPTITNNTYDGGSSLAGPTIVTGERYGREVEIVMEANRYRTVVRGSYPEFTLRGTSTGLTTAERTPRPVTDVLRTVDRDRWDGSRWTAVPAASGCDGGCAAATAPRRCGSATCGWRNVLPTRPLLRTEPTRPGCGRRSHR